MVSSGVELLSDEGNLQNHIPEWKDLCWERPDRYLTYFGSVNSVLVEKDFLEVQRRDFSISKEILMESEDADEINRIESMFILEY